MNQLVERNLKLAETERKKQGLLPSLAVCLSTLSEYIAGDKESAHSAKRAAGRVYSQNPSSPWAFAMYIFINIEIGSQEVWEYLSGFKTYRNYYKSSDTDVYAAYLFLSALYEIKIGKEKRSARHVRLLTELEEQPGFIVLLFLGIFHYSGGNFGESIAFLKQAYYRGCRSFFMYFYAHIMYRDGAVESDAVFFAAYLKWSAQKGNLTQHIVENNKNLTISMLESHYSVIRHICDNFQIDWLLVEICQRHMANKDYSLSAYEIYKKSESKQLSIDGLSYAFIKAAFINGVDHISIFALNDVIFNYQVEAGLLPYVFYQLTGKQKHSLLIEEYGIEEQVIGYALKCLKENKEGRFYNCVYKYAFTCLMESSPKEGEQFREILYKNLFAYDVILPENFTGYLWIQEKEKLNMSTYRAEGGRVRIKLATGNFDYFLLDDSQKKILSGIEPVFENQMENADCRLYEQFVTDGFGRKDHDQDLYIALSYYYINLENPEADFTEILNKTLTLGNISPVFRMRVSAALGDILSRQHRYDKALEYFKEVNENLLNERYIEIMLTAFMSAKDYDKSMRLIIKKREYISDRLLFSSLKELAAIPFCKPFIADPAYELVLNNYYDKKLLEIVLEYYNGSLQEWLMLRRNLLSISLDDQRLDEIILSNSIWMRDFSKDVQLVFLGMYRQNPENQLVQQFVYYACYEMIINLIKPEYDVLAVLEKIFAKSENRLLAYALCRIYFKYAIDTFESDQIIKKVMSYMEEDAILLSEFRSVKDKNYLTAYIEKNQPFFYRCSSEKRVFLYYRFDGDTEFKSKEMEYKIFGIFYTALPVFFQEKTEFYFSEQMSTGSVNTKPENYINTRAGIREGNRDLYFLINNALIYSHMFKYDEAEKLINEMLREGPGIMGRIL